jgi:hypothetical protein
MDSDRLNRWLTLGANLGVLVGIIILAVEIRQNSDLARLQFSDDRRATWQQGEMVLFGDSIAEVWEKSVLNPESLSLSETRILDAYLAFQLTNSSRVFDLEKAGLLEDGATQQWMQGNLPFFFDTEFAKTWWEIEGRTWGDEFVLLADPIILETTKNQSVNKLLKIQRETALRVRSSQ